MQPADIDRLLAETDFFQGISEPSRRAMASICAPRTVKKGASLFYEGEPGEAVCILAAGSVQLHKTTPEGRDAVIRVIRPGEMFGEVILFERSDYPVTAVAVERSEILFLSRTKLLSLLASETFRADFISMLMKKLRTLTRQIRILRTHDLEERLFLFLEEHYGRKETMTAALPKKDVASALGVTPEAFSRLLSRLRKTGLLRWDSTTIRLKKGFWAER